MLSTTTKTSLRSSLPNHCPSNPVGQWVSEEVYWKKYYHYCDPIRDCTYEWNNGYLEEKPVSDFNTQYMYRWFVQLLDQYLFTYPIATATQLEMGFRLALPHKTAIRRPDLGVICHHNPILPHGDDCSYRGTFDMCVEALSDSDKGEIERDTVTKFAEYEMAGVKEYYILYAKGEPMEFYQLNSQGVYVPIPPVDGVIKSAVLPGFQFRKSDLYNRPSLKEMSEDKVYQGFVWPEYQAEKRARQEETQARLLAEVQWLEETQTRQLAEARLLEEQRRRQLAETQTRAKREVRQILEARLKQLEAELAKSS
jgi:hypothetical protein